MASQEVLTALETLHREIEKLEPAIKHVETAQQVTQMVKSIPKKHLELLQEVKSNDAKHKDELKSIFSDELTRITDEGRKIQKATSDIQKQIKLEQEALADLRGTVQEFHDRVLKINFPARLDKLDANIAGIMSAVLAIQGRLDLVERNMADKMKDLLEYQKDTRTNMQKDMGQMSITTQAAIDTAAKKQQTLSYITWALVLVVIVITFVLKK